MAYADAIRLYTEISACPLRCAGITNDPSIGVIPRSYFMLNTTPSVSVLIVSKNPGQSPIWEQQIYRAARQQDLAHLHLDFANKVFSGRQSVPSRYHANLIRWTAVVLGVPPTYEDVFSQAALTALVKCQSAGSAQAALPMVTKHCCSTQHLYREISLLRPRFLLALGKEVYDFLTRNDVQRRHGLSVGKMQHPSWENMPGGPAEYINKGLLKLRQQYLAAIESAI